MKSKSKQVLVVGDRLLIQPDKGDKTSPAGLYLPPSVVEKQEVKGGIVVEVGPGIPLGSPNDTIDEPWKDSKSDIKYIPTQAEIGDYALYLGKASIEIEIAVLSVKTMVWRCVALLPQPSSAVKVRRTVKSPAQSP